MIEHLGADRDIGEIFGQRPWIRAPGLRDIAFFIADGADMCRLASCPHQEETRNKRVPLVAAGSDPLPGKLVPECPKWSGCQLQQRGDPAKVAICCRKRDPFQGLKEGSYLTFRSECLRRQSKRFYPEGAPRQRVGG